jgi:hypothetical protein
MRRPGERPRRVLLVCGVALSGEVTVGVDRAEEYVELGFARLVFRFAGGDQQRALRQFAKDLGAPRARALEPAIQRRVLAAHATSRRGQYRSVGERLTPRP